MTSHNLWFQVDGRIQSLNRAQLLTHLYCPDYFLERCLNGFPSWREHGYTDTHFQLIKRLLFSAKDDFRHPEKARVLNTQVVYLRIASLYSAPLSRDKNWTVTGLACVGASPRSCDHDYEFDSHNKIVRIRVIPKRHECTYFMRTNGHHSSLESKPCAGVIHYV